MTNVSQLFDVNILFPAQAPFWFAFHNRNCDPLHFETGDIDQSFGLFLSVENMKSPPPITSNSPLSVSLLLCKYCLMNSLLTNWLNFYGMNGMKPLTWPSQTKFNPYRAIEIPYWFLFHTFSYKQCETNNIFCQSMRKYSCGSFRCFAFSRNFIAHYQCFTTDFVVISAT